MVGRLDLAVGSVTQSWKYHASRPSEEFVCSESTGRAFFASRNHPSWIISSWGFESSWYPFDVTRTSCSRLQVPNLLVTDGSIVKTISFCTSFSPCLPYLFGHLGPRRGPIS